MDEKVVRKRNMLIISVFIVVVFCFLFFFVFFFVFLFFLESSGGWGSTPNAFIFSLRNKEGLAPFKSKVANQSNTINRFSGYGPYFGGGPDIHIADKANSNRNSVTDFGSSYSAPSGVRDPHTILAGTRFFSPDDWEVYYLVTKTPKKGIKIN